MTAVEQPIQDASDMDLLMQPVVDSSPMEEDTPQIRDLDVNNSVGIKTIEAAPEAEDPGVAGSYTYVLEHYSTFREPQPGGIRPKLETPKFEAGGLTWHLNIYPLGNTKANTLAVFLAPDATPEEEARDLVKEDRFEGWCRNTEMEFSVINHRDPSLSIVKQTNTTFSDSQADWGFNDYLQISHIRAPDGGFLKDDGLTIKTVVTVKPPMGDWYDSKARTGYVGLKNQGATCYLNSWLQTLFHINYFRKAVFDIPTTEEDEPSKSISLALQTLFYKMQFGRLSVSTADLTRSFGWDQYGALMQEDVHEFNKILCDALEEKMKGTKVEGVINRLFEGHIQKSITCLNVPYKSTKRDAYMDVFLDVRGCKNIYDSFDRLTAKERMDGANQYNAEGYGLQDAEIGDQYDEFPAVLQLHLKRFEYDFERDIRVKVNDRYEFYEELDLDVGDGKYLSPDADRSKRNKYRLHSVLVHSGGTHGGHYYAYSRPDGVNWLKFEDEQVTKESRKAAMDDQFGGESDAGKVRHQFSSLFKSQNAYMLVYIREAEWDEIMCPVAEEDVALHLRERVRRQEEERGRKAREEKDKHLYTVIKAARAQDLQEQIGSTLFWDIVDFEQVTKFRRRKETLFSDFQAEIAQQWGVPVQQQRWWLCKDRSNATVRVHRPIEPAEYSQRVSAILPTNQGAQHPQRDPHEKGLLLYLEAPTATGRPLPTHSHKYVLLFLKYYDARAKQLRYVMQTVLHRSNKLEEVLDQVRRRAGLPEGLPLRAFEEVKPTPRPRLDPIAVDKTLSTHPDIQDGDIIILEQALSEAESRELACPSVANFMEYVLMRLNVTFINLDEPKDKGFVLELMRTDSYDAVAVALAQHLHLPDPSFVHFTQQSSFSKAPKVHAVPWRGMDSLQQLLTCSGQLGSTLYYRLLDMPLAEWESMKTVKVAFHNERTEEVGKEGYRVRVPKTATVAQLLEQVRQRVSEAAGSGPLRLLEVRDCRICQVFSPDKPVLELDDHAWTLRAEPVPADEVELSDYERLLHVYHVTFDEMRKKVKLFGDPLLVKASVDDRLSDITARIQAKLQAKPDDFAAWKWSWHSNLAPPEELQDNDTLEGRLKQRVPGGMYSDFLGAEHADPAPRRKYRRQDSSRIGYERPMKILS